ncbi:MAG: cytochrome c peroxidase [Candidatus Paceibacteria bacterium]|jgi:cytochrome c peroxidase
MTPSWLTLLRSSLPLLALFVGATQEGPRRTPADTLPTPLVRVELLGAEELAAGWSARAEEVALGRRLFFDSILSRDKSVACATCHQPEFAFADDKRFSIGIDNQRTSFNSPSLINKALSTNVFWDGRASSIESQVLLPIQNETEMGLGLEEALERVTADATYSADFQATYQSAPNEQNLAKAMSAFIRALAFADSPVDRFRNGETTALNSSERAGLWVYEGRGGCWKCHVGPNLSDEQFHNTGIGSLEGIPLPGRSGATGEITDLGKFRTPGLRMLTKTAPYMHDGSLATLEEVIEFYREGGHANENLSPKLKPIDLSDEDAKNLVAFLRALSR